MINVKEGDKVMFTTHKGTVKFGTVIHKRSRLTWDEYEDVVDVEVGDDNKMYTVDEAHLIESYGQ
jgi:ribosomal protein S4E